MARPTISDTGSVATSSTANASASCASRNSLAATRQVPRISGISASATVSAPKSRVPGKPSRSIPPASQNTRLVNTSATYWPIEMRKSSARTGRKSASRPPASRFCFRPCHSVAAPDCGSISAERLDRGDPRAAHLCGDIGVRALRGDFPGIDARGCAERAPQQHARQVRRFPRAPLSPLETLGEREQLLEPFGPAQSVATFQQREQVRRAKCGGPPDRLGVPRRKEREVAAVPGRLESLAHGDRRLGGASARGDEREARGEAEPLGRGALERADQNARGVVRRPPL